MKRWAELDPWIGQRWDPLAESLLDLATACSGPETGSAAVVADYLGQHIVDDLTTIELGSGAPAVFAQRLRTAGAPNVLILGIHNAPSPEMTDADGDQRIFADDEGVVGPGVSSRFGGFVAQVEGFFGTMAGRDGNAPINAQFLCLPDSAYTAAGVGEALAAIPQADLEAVIATSGTSWELMAPTVTVGSRGHLLVDVTIHGGPDLDASTFAGSSRNPLSLLVEILSQLREPNGRIAIPGFYHRALRASADTRDGLAANGYDPNSWQRGSGAVEFTSLPSALERASLWPSVDVLSVQSGSGPRVADLTIPGQASARILFELVPAQRSEEIEVALKSWVEGRLKPGLTVSTRVISESDAHLTDPSHPALATQVRSVKRVIGGKPIFVPSGGMSHMGLVARETSAAILHAGLGSPLSHVHTNRERLLTSRLITGTNVAGELLSQLGKPRTLLG